MSNFEAVDCITEDENGVRLAMAGATVKVCDAASPGTTLATYTADANGRVAAGSLAVPVGTRLLFRVENYNGVAGSCAKITT